MNTDRSSKTGFDSKKDLRSDLVTQITQTMAPFRKKEPEVFRGLVQLAKDWNKRAPEFALLLRRAKMEAPRVSEITLIIGIERVRDSFLRGRSWKDSLEAARKCQPKAIKKAAIRLKDLLLEHAEKWPTGGLSGWTLVIDSAALKLLSKRGTLTISRKPIMPC